MRFCILGCALLWFGCRSEEVPRIDILALGHIYRWDDSNDRVDPRIAALRRDTFEQLWLLGDLLGRTDEKPENYHYLDSLFELTSPRTLWVEGNHDVNTGRVKAHPLRPAPFSAHRLDGLHVWRLNTNLFVWPGSKQPPQVCAMAAAQLDSIQLWTTRLLRDRPAHLVVLHHQVVLTDVNFDGQPLNKVWNYYRPDLWVSCDTHQPFSEALLPLFEQLQANGTQVTFVGGDIGQRTKTFDAVAPSGIRYLGTGINNSMNPEYPPAYVSNLNPDSILLLQYFPSSNKLSFNFVPLGQESAAYQAIWDK